jgi:hypothetical protein
MTPSQYSPSQNKDYPKTSLDIGNSRQRRSALNLGRSSPKNDGEKYNPITNERIGLSKYKSMAELDDPNIGSPVDKKTKLDDYYKMKDDEKYHKSPKINDSPEYQPMK